MNKMSIESQICRQLDAAMDCVTTGDDEKYRLHLSIAEDLWTELLAPVKVMNVEEMPADELVVMTQHWHKAFNVHGCNPMCHCCGKFIGVGEKFKLATTLVRPEWHVCLHWYNDINELMIKALSGEEIVIDDLQENKEKDFFFDEKFKNEGGLEGIKKIVQPSERDVMLCDVCTPEKIKQHEINSLKIGVSERDRPKRGGCFRVNGKIII